MSIEPFKVNFNVYYSYRFISYRRLNTIRLLQKPVSYMLYFREPWKVQKCTLWLESRIYESYTW
jgi:hypothetical protein